MEINIVPDSPCPECGAYWGNPDPKLNFPNRCKVDDWWKCYNPECRVGYYHPATGQIELKPSPEEMEEIKRRSKERVAKIRFGKPRYFKGGVEIREVRD